MATRLTILCENSVGRPGSLIGEHGFACLVENGRGRFLFDTGQGLGIAANVRVLNLDLRGLSGVILSHGHYDHAGGLAAVLGVTGPIDVFAHPGIFRPRYWVSDHSCRFIGLPQSRDDLEALGARFRFVDRFCEIAAGIYLSGSIPRVTPFETGDPHLRMGGSEEGAYPRDPLQDDLSLILDTPRGLVVLLGCAHAGLINILTHVRNRLPRRAIYAVIGGTHLGPTSEGQFEETLEALKRFKVGRFGLSHCTGQERAAQIHARFPVATFFASVGTVFEIS